MEPISGQARLLLEKVEKGRRHPGLLLDKLLKPAKSQEDQKARIDEVCGAGKFTDILEGEWLPRREAILQACRAEQWTRTTQGRLTLHLARASVLENAGLCLHPIYGFAYFPGTGLKGMARAYAETIWRPAQQDKAQADEIIEAVFGKSADAGGGCAASGTVVFHEAWPTRWPLLKTDIVNNHHKDYYQEGKAPADWDDPNPVYFFCLPDGQEFSFAVSPRRGDIPGEHLSLARLWLDGALTHLGLGAKTSAGYGYFGGGGEEDPGAQGLAGRAEARAVVELVSPAFLAGANQADEGDCELRSATLKGLLRWWWRILYSGYLDAEELRSFESAIWGSTAAGSAVQVIVVPRRGQKAKRFDYKEGYNPRAEFAREHLLEQPPRKITWGLFYLSYGMDDDKSKAQRYFLDAGASWEVRLVARAAKIAPDQTGPRQAEKFSLSAEEVLAQARAALWLLASFGGVGAKGRNGFGSLEIVEPEDWRKMNLDSVRTVGLELLRCMEQSGWKTAFSEARALSSSLGTMLDPLEIPTVWSDPWHALDQVGLAYQAFTKKYKHNARKLALGLPRKIHGPRNKPMRHQRPETHTPPEDLTRRLKERKNRFASPIHIHLGRAEEGKISIRIVAFPTPLLPDMEQSREVLREFLEIVEAELRERAKRPGTAPPAPRASSPRGGAPGPRTGKRREDPGKAERERKGIPSPGDRVEAVFLEEKTRKGGWKARHEPTGFQGPVVNSAEVPEDKKPGETVSLVVHSVRESKKEMSFKWPTS